MVGPSISTLDYSVIIGYLILIFVMAARLKFTKEKHSELPDSTQGHDYLKEQYLANKSLTLGESLFSIIATEVSALTFLGIPAFAYGKDYSFLQIYIGALFGRIIIARYFIPHVYDKGLTIYSVMGKGGTRNGQRTIALFYSINKFLAVGVRLFSGSILIAEFFTISIYAAVAMISLITFFYTLLGGLKAVVRTDMLQMGLFVIGGLVAHFIIPDVAQVNWAELMSTASLNGKTSLFSFSNPSSFFIGVLGGILFDMATHGVDQDFVQRLTGNKTLRGAQKAIFLSSFISIAVGLLFLSIGSLLWSHYQVTPPPEIPADKLFAYFITHHFPSGLKGLMVAGVLAATMSTLDSTINALSASFYNDILSHSEKSQQKIKNFYRRDTFFMTIILMLIAFVASKSDGVLIFGLKITSWTAGPLVGLFMATVPLKSYFKTSLSAPIVIISYALGITAVAINTYVLKLPWQWNVYFGCTITFIYLLIIKNLNLRV